MEKKDSILRRLNPSSSFMGRVVLIVFGLLTLVMLIDKLIVVNLVKNTINKRTNGYLLDVAYAYTNSLETAVEKNGSEEILNPEYLTILLTGITCSDINNSYCYLVAKDGTMLFHKDPAKIGSPVVNAEVKNVCERLRSGERIEEYVTTYAYNGGIQYAAIAPSDDGSFVMVVVASEENVLEAVNRLTRECISLNILCVTLASIGMAIVMYTVVKPLSKAKDEANRFGKLDFRDSDELNRIAARKDEVGQIGTAVVDIQKGVATALGDIKQQETVLYEEAGKIDEQISGTNEAVAQVNSAIQEIATSSTSQAQDTQDATDKVAKMGTAVEDTVTEVKNLYETTNSAKMSGDEAVSTLVELEKITKTATSAIDAIYAQTNATNESVLKIHEATALITAIAEETNLLSLNASIEAARAGEQGRGFAVVAGQIQKLAEQSNASAGKIEDIINTLINESNKSVKTMEEVMEVMKSQSEQINKTEEIIREVKERIGETIEGVDIIDKSAKNIEASRAAVNDIISNLSAIAEENAANTEETLASISMVSTAMEECAASAKGVKNIAQTLDGTIGKFTL
ncbi:MAG: hypothetical protein K6B75_08475 [Lachnospiraceae bacterium]|nr:hypothetical protein [Lachnospiraceae bacterium]